MKQALRVRRVLCMAAVSLGACSTAAAQPGCFQSVAAAVNGTGVEDAQGFRVEAATHSTLDGLTWARVRSCAHPGWPPRLVRTGARTAPPQSPATPAFEPFAIIMRAGAPVTVLSLEPSVRLQIAGIAIEGGALGQRVRVRIASDGEERFVAGLVKSADTLEMVR